MARRWIFPRVEGIIVDREAGRWSESAFFHDLLDSDDQVPEVWHQAEPAPENNRPDDWRRWIEYLRTDRAKRTVAQVVLLNAERRLRNLGTHTPRREKRHETSVFFVPMQDPLDVIPLLGNPDHWEVGRSAYELAYAWYKGGDIPSRVKSILDESVEYKDARIVFGAFEHTTRIDEFPSPSQTDLLLMLDLSATGASDSRAVVAVEGKVDEPFDKIVARKRSEAGKRSNWPERLRRLCKALALDISAAEVLRYQLIHRTAAAIFEARRWRAKHAMLLVHSFVEANPKFDTAAGDSFDDFEKFARAIGFADIGRNHVTESRRFNDIELRLAWVTDRPAQATV